MMTVQEQTERTLISYNNMIPAGDAYEQRSDQI